MLDPLIGKREEITDLLSEKAIRSFKVGHLLVFKVEDDTTCIRITRLDRKNMRAWGLHIEPMEAGAAMSHYGHNVDRRPEKVKERGGIWCLDCQRMVAEPATEEGNVKAHLRRQKVQNAQIKKRSEHME